jgi:hypothetical protein
MKKLIFGTLALFLATSAIADGGTEEKKKNDNPYLGTYSLFLENNRNEAFRLFQGSESERDTSWKFGGIVGLNFNQVAFVNWAAGGQNSIAYTAIGSVFARYEKGKSLWVTSLDLAYGQSKLGRDKLRKTDDRIELNSKYGYKIDDKWFASALLNFRTQFDKGYNLPNDSVVISDFMAPAYLTFGLGIDYVPNENFSIMASPLTAKITFVSNQTLANAGQFGMEPAVFDTAGNILTIGANVRYELGAALNAVYTNKFYKDNIFFSSRLGLFSNYMDRPENIDVNAEAMLTLKVNKFMNVSIAALLIYDHDITIREVVDVNDPTQDRFGPRTQFKEVLSVGISYTIK